MPRQQERARRTRAAIVEAAAHEFAKRGYAAASVNAILENSHATKGAMYFHFDSKEDLARAVLASAFERYAEVAERWRCVAGMDPFVALHRMIDDLARLFEDDVIVQAEFRLVIEPEFYRDVRSGGARVVGETGYELALRAQEQGLLRPGADPGRFARVLGACLAGQRYMADLTSENANVRERFEESVEVVLEAMASEEWLARWRRDGWPRKHREEVGSGNLLT